MNVLFYELRQIRKSLVSWAVTLAASVFIIMLAAPMFVEESSSMKDLLDSFPDSIKSAMGIDIDTFFSALGFYSYIFLYMTLAAAIQALNLGIGIISKEYRMKTADFLMCKPVRRGSIYAQKLLAALCTLAVTDAAFLLSASLSISLQTNGAFDVKVFVLISLTFVFMQLVYLAIGFFLAAAADKIKSPAFMTMGIAFGTFIAGMVGMVTDSEILRYLSPLRYFDNNYIMLNKSYETRFLVISSALVFILIAAGFAVYIKKDVKSVT